MRSVIHSFLAISLLAGPLPLLAQADRSSRTVLNGSVVDPNGQPISGAEVFVGDSKTPLVTNGEGRFRLLDAPTRPIWVFARSIGYEPARRSLRLKSGETRDFQVVLERLPVRLPDVEVRKRSGFESRRLADLWPRFRAGWGRFITRDEIERRRPAVLSQLVRPYFPFAPLYFDPFFDSDLQRGFGRGHCSPAVSLNGHFPWEGDRLDDYPVSSIEAVEVYRPRFSEVPIQFSHMTRAANCGLVVVWTN